MTTVRQTAQLLNVNPVEFIFGAMSNSGSERWMFPGQYPVFLKLNTSAFTLFTGYIIGF